MTRLRVTVLCRRRHQLAIVTASPAGPVIRILRPTVDRLQITKVTRHRYPMLLDATATYIAPCKCQGLRVIPGSKVSAAVRSGEPEVVVD